MIGTSLVVAALGIGAGSTHTTTDPHPSGERTLHLFSVKQAGVEYWKTRYWSMKKYARKQEIEKGRVLQLVTALRRKLHPPAPSLGGIPASIYRAFICIHNGEGSWTDSGDPYWGGLQMDRSFMQTYGSWAIKRYHGWANVWPPSVQIAVAYKAYSSGRGFYPWPTTARNCGLI